MKIIVTLFLTILTTTLFLTGCKPENNCPDTEFWGYYELLDSSKKLIDSLESNIIAVFIDSTGKEIRYTLFRNENLYVRQHNCDQNENGRIDSGEPLVYESQLEATNISYNSSDFQDIHLSLHVEYPANEDPVTKENFENSIYDYMSISMANQGTFTWTVDKRIGGIPVPEYQVHFSKEITLNGKLFKDVYWDDKYLSNVFNRYIIYFNAEYGIVGIKNTFNGYVLNFDRFE